MGYAEDAPVKRLGRAFAGGFLQQPASQLGDIADAAVAGIPEMPVPEYGPQEPLSPAEERIASAGESFGDDSLGQAQSGAELAASLYGEPPAADTSRMSGTDIASAGYGAPPPTPTTTPSRPAVRGGMPRRYGPPEGTMGGHYYGPEFTQGRLDRLSELATMELQGQDENGNPIDQRKIDAERAKLTAEINQASKHGYTSEGIGQDIARDQSKFYERKGEHEAQLMELDSQMLANKRRMLTDLDVQDEQWQRARQQRQEDYNAGHTKMAEDLARAQEEVAKSQIVGDRRSASEKAIGAIGVALGALGAAWAKTPNFAMEILQKRLEADIDAQKANLANKRASLGDKRQMMAIYKEHFGDNEMAELATRADMYRTADRRLEMMQGKVGGEKNEKAIQYMRGELQRIEGDTEKALMHKGAMNYEMQQALARRDAAAAEARRAKAERARVVATDDELERYVPGWGIMAPGGEKGAVTQLRQKAADWKSLEQNMLRYEQLASKPKASWTMKDYDEANQLRSSNTSAKIKELAGAAFSETEKEIHLPQFGKDLTSVSDKALYDVANSSRMVRERLGREMRNTMEGHNVIPAQVSGPVFDENEGKRVRVIQYGQQAPSGTGGARLQEGVAPRE